MLIVPMNSVMAHVGERQLDRFSLQLLQSTVGPRSIRKATQRRRDHDPVRATRSLLGYTPAAQSFSSCSLQSRACAVGEEWGLEPRMREQAVFSSSLII